MERLKLMIKDKKLEIEARKSHLEHADPGSDAYSKLTQDLNSVKLMILNLKTGAA